MAKVFYVINHNEGEGGVDFFKTEKEALAYGKEQFEQFEMGKEVKNEDGTVYHGDALTFKKGILFSYEEDGTKLQAIEDADARQYAEDLEEMGSAVFFEGFVKGMYCFLGRNITGKNIKWSWDGDGINESEVKSSLKHVQLFEQFVNEKRLKGRDLRELTDDYGYEATMDGRMIYVTGENPWRDNKEYTFSWDGDYAYCETDISDSEYNQPVTSAEEFSSAIDDTDNWE